MPVQTSLGCRLLPAMSAPAVAQPPSGPTVVGKPELLEWLNRISSLELHQFTELKDGVALLRALHHIFPAAVDTRKAKIAERPKFEWEVLANWDIIRASMETLHMPGALCDKTGIQNGRFKPCYSILVMLYFLAHLAEHKDFTVDFAHPIDSKLAAFLQSPASVDALLIGGALPPPAGTALPVHPAPASLASPHAASHVATASPSAAAAAAPSAAATAPAAAAASVMQVPAPATNALPALASGTGSATATEALTAANLFSTLAAVTAPWQGSAAGSSHSMLPGHAGVTGTHLGGSMSLTLAAPPALHVLQSPGSGVAPPASAAASSAPPQLPPAPFATLLTPPRAFGGNHAAAEGLAAQLWMQHKQQTSASGTGSGPATQAHQPAQTEIDFDIMVPPRAWRGVANPRERGKRRFGSQWFTCVLLSSPCDM